MTRVAVERSLCHAQLELMRLDDQALDEAHRWLVRALIDLEELRHPRPKLDDGLELISRVLKEPTHG